MADDRPEVSILDSPSGGNGGATQPTERNRNEVVSDTPETGLAPATPNLAEVAAIISQSQGRRFESRTTYSHRFIAVFSLRHPQRFVR